jgi:hypothetical protein
MKSGENMKIDEVTNHMERKIFVDMDRVIADFDKKVCEFNNIPLEFFVNLDWKDKDPYWNNVQKSGKIMNFFANMDWCPNGRNLLQWLKDHNLNYTLLTRPTKPPTTHECIAGKKYWLTKHGVTNPVIFEFDKEKYAGNGNILIDDHSGNIEKWIKANGIGIHYDDSKFSEVIDKLTEIVNEIV